MLEALAQRSDALGAERATVVLVGAAELVRVQTARKTLADFRSAI